MKWRTSEWSMVYSLTWLQLYTEKESYYPACSLLNDYMDDANAVSTKKREKKKNIYFLFFFFFFEKDELKREKENVTVQFVYLWCYMLHKLNTIVQRSHLRSVYIRVYSPLSVHFSYIKTRADYEPNYSSLSSWTFSPESGAVSKGM